MQANAPPAEVGKARRFSPWQGCALALLLMGAGVWLVFSAARLISLGELSWGSELSGGRLWLVQEAENRGLGLTTTCKVAAGQGEGEVCARTSLRLLLWAADGSAEETSYCRCYRMVEGSYQFVGTCAP